MDNLFMFLVAEALNEAKNLKMLFMNQLCFRIHISTVIIHNS